MPAAAVIPAPIAYANAVAVKKLVVGFKGCGCIRPGETSRQSVHAGLSVSLSTVGLTVYIRSHSYLVATVVRGSRLNWRWKRFRL